MVGLSVASPRSAYPESVRGAHPCGLFTTIPARISALSFTRIFNFAIRFIVLLMLEYL
jgi:hypothetical protein